MKKRLFLLRCLTAAAISLTFLLTLAACGVQSASNTGDNTASSTDPAQIEIDLDGESFLEVVFSQPTSDGRGRITYYRDRVTDVLYMNVFCKSATGYAGAGGLTAMLDPDTGKPLTYARYMEMFSALNG